MQFARPLSLPLILQENQEVGMGFSLYFLVVRQEGPLQLFCTQSKSFSAEEEEQKRCSTNGTVVENIYFSISSHFYFYIRQSLPQPLLGGNWKIMVRGKFHWTDYCLPNENNIIATCHIWSNCKTLLKK